MSNILQDLVTALSQAVSKTSGTSGVSGFSGTQAFFQAEQKISNSPCDAIYPAVAVDPFGNAGVAWQDNRNGNWEIYFRVLPSNVSLSLSGSYVGTLDCSGFSSIHALSGVSGFSGSGSGGSLVQSGGRLDVNDLASNMVLTATQGTFSGVLPNATVTIVNGVNSGMKFYVSSVLAPTVLQLVYITGAVSDTGFVYSISNASVVSSTPESRLTCDVSSSMFPDIVADKQGRFHVVYQDNETGNYELWYVQVYPESVGELTCVSGNLPVGSFGFSTVPAGTTGNTVQISVPVTDPATGQQTTATTTWQPTGNAGTFFAFGNRLLPDPIPLTTGNVLARTGKHRLFMNFFPGDGSWTGVSMVDDYATWQAQCLNEGISVIPDYVATPGNPLANPGDFGTTYDFKNLAFMAQTPPDMAVMLTQVSLPLKPRCLPTAASNANTTNYLENLIVAPKKPAPPGFVDPVDLSGVLSSPLTRLNQSLPERFMLANDQSGTVFTNIVTENGAGESSIFVFECESTPQGEEPIFILGQRKCGPGPCALSREIKSQSVAAASYKIRLQVWQGSDYRIQGDQASSAQMPGSLLIEKEFSFDPGDDMSTFSFKDGELIAEEGKYLFFVPIAEDDTTLYVDGVGGGHALWYTNSDGNFSQYYIPFTVQPNKGLNIPVYYEGFLALPTGGNVTGSSSSSVTGSSSSSNTSTSGDSGGGSGGGAGVGEYMVTPPLQLTSSNGDSVHPRLAIDNHNNIWLVFYSNRTGADEVYVSRYFGGCGQWATSVFGGTEYQLTDSGADGKDSQFPSVAVDFEDEANVVWQSTDTEDGLPDIFYTKTTGGGQSFLAPIRISASPGNALMPDIAIVTSPNLSTGASPEPLGGVACPSSSSSVPPSTSTTIICPS